MKKLKYVFPLAFLLIIWAGLAVFCWLKPADDLSVSERRKLTQFPELTAQAVLSGGFSEDFEEAALDQFPLRDAFRRIKALSVYYVLGQKDNNGVYISDEYASKLEYPTNTASVIKAGEKLTYIYDTYLDGHAQGIYLSVIPDKNYFLAGENGYPHIDYESLVDTIKSEADFASYIDIFPYLELTDYYKTDSHWRQENIIELASVIADSLGASVTGDYNVIDSQVDFHGVYYGQSAMPLPSEKIYYLTNSAIESCTVYDPTTDKYSQVYNMDKLTSRDPYEMYLSGAMSVLRITNPTAESSRRLVIFRDSFASSLAPLLIESYSEITLVDTRYISPALLGDYVDFEGAEVLFMYSASILNSSDILK